LSAVGLPELPVNAAAQAMISAGGNADSSVEISLMLDVTGSMGGQKIADLKAAAKDLIDIVVWDDQSRQTSRVAIAPFSEHVNVGRADYQAIVGVTPPGSGNAQTCIRERRGMDRYTDAAPGTGNWFDPGAETWQCKPQSTIMPLSNNKSALKAHIDSLSAEGYTAGHLGTAWAWYTLSPNWNTVWTTNSHAAPYTSKTRKIAVLMTDGEYNRAYSGATSAEQARAICANMKSSGITVYTIGFQIAAGGEAYQTLSQCASSSSHFFNSTTGNELRQAFREIALQVVTLRLSN
ncbi:MAG: VWA domain-containing protein, partial [Hyphomicrobiaceae bacterium]|nr:VWA domain-containing protein [Hyphomicrobiaceae bacterium]